MNNTANHPKDILIVRNILVGDDTPVDEIHPDTKEVTTWNTKDGFQFKYDGQTYVIPPGETRRYYRFLAEHFADRLIEFILLQREVKEKKALVSNETERAQLHKEIIVDVESYFLDSQTKQTQGEQTKQEVDKLNQEDDLDLNI